MSQVQYPGLSPQARRVVLSAYTCAEESNRDEVYTSDYWSALISSRYWLATILQSLFLAKAGSKSHRELQVVVPQYMRRLGDPVVKNDHIILGLLRLQNSTIILFALEYSFCMYRLFARQAAKRRVADSRKREWSMLR